MNPLPTAKGKISQAHTSGIFLEKPGLLKEALKRNKEWRNVMPGSSSIGTLEVHNRVSTLEESLLRLKEEKQAAETVRDAPMVVNPNDDGQLIVTTNTVANDGAPTAGTPGEEEELDEEDELDVEE